ncbi:AMP-binding protein, partial [Micromonospora carbonacea]|uniref:AMP-binding protein n=1 Tax=Micromonospora carbonacea TaxID=47853 RepID=UPI0033C936D3
MHQHGIGVWTARRRLKSPDKVALVHGEGDTVTYRQLADAVDRVSAALRQLGVGRGDAVAYLGENSPEFLQVMFAAAQVGAVFVPVNTRLAPPEIGHVLADCGARVLIHDPDLAGAVAVVGPAARPPPRLVARAGGGARPGPAPRARA